MCKCNECDKYGTENCIRSIESCSHQQTETMKVIEIEALKHNYDNLLRGIEKMIQTMSQASFWETMYKEKGE